MRIIKRSIPFSTSHRRRSLIMAHNSLVITRDQFTIEREANIVAISARHPTRGRLETIVHLSKANQRNWEEYAISRWIALNG